jgi:hypothetical protein
VNETTTEETDETTDTEIEEQANKNPPHPVAEAVNRFIHRARDIRFAARAFIPVAAPLMKKQLDEVNKQLEEGKALLSSDDEVEKMHGVERVSNVLPRLERLTYSDVPAVIESSLFLSLFSAFDAYTGELLSVLYERKPELFKRLNRSMAFSEILEATSIEDVKRTVLDNEIEAFRRKSYVEQFEHLETTFGLTLKAFDRWAAFFECSQRRNLLTHCGGVVSEQYRTICKREGYPENKLAAVGGTISLGAGYFLSTCELMIEVGLKLGQTLWRKLLPDELTAADQHLHHTQYEALRAALWDRAKVFGEFAVGQRQLSNDVERRIALINYAIALKFSNEEAKAREVLATVDWSASSNDFRPAEAVLLDRFGDASTIMRRIGKKGELVRQEGYHVWPLFRAFRQTNEFMGAYQEIYGYPFVDKLKRDAEAANADAQEAIERQDRRDVEPSEDLPDMVDRVGSAATDLITESPAT